MGVDFDIAAKFLGEKPLELRRDFVGLRQRHGAVDFEIEAYGSALADELHGEVVDGERPAPRGKHHLVEDAFIVERHRVGGHRNIRGPIVPLDRLRDTFLDHGDVIKRQGAAHVDGNVDEQRGARGPDPAALDGEHPVGPTDDCRDPVRGSFRGRIEKRVDRPPAKAPAGEGDKKCDYQGGEGVGLGIAHRHRTEAGKNGQRAPHVG